MEKMTTTELGRLAGVSQSTVARVIILHPRLSPEKVRAVRAAMKKLGYVPRKRRREQRKRAGPTRGSGNVAVLVIDESYMRHSTLTAVKLRAVGEALREAGLNMIFAHVTDPKQLPPAVDRGDVDGILLWGHRAARALMKKLPTVPVGWLSSHTNTVGDDVLPGNEAVGRLAADYLLGRGHKRLAFLSIASMHPGLGTRGDGFCYAAHQAGVQVRLVVDDRRQGEGFEQWDREQLESSVVWLVERLLASEPRATGLFVPDDQITAVVHRRLVACKVRPGRDVTIISANNEEPYLAGLHPRPATIDVGPEATGRLAVERLLQQIRRPHDTRRVQVVVEPIVVNGEEDIA